MPLYYKIHTFSQLEEFSPSFLEISSNFKSINFSVNKTFSNDHCFGLLKTHKSRSYLSKDVILPNTFKVIDPDFKLFELLSSKFKLKSILEIYLCYFFSLIYIYIVRFKVNIMFFNFLLNINY